MMVGLAREHVNIIVQGRDSAAEGFWRASDQCQHVVTGLEAGVCAPGRDWPSSLFSLVVDLGCCSNETALWDHASSSKASLSYWPKTLSCTQGVCELTK
jgi:hypothetical protein